MPTSGATFAVGGPSGFSGCFLDVARGPVSSPFSEAVLLIVPLAASVISYFSIFEGRACAKISAGENINRGFEMGA